MVENYTQTFVSILKEQNTCIKQITRDHFLTSCNFLEPYFMELSGGFCPFFFCPVPRIMHNK